MTISTIIILGIVISLSGGGHFTHWCWGIDNYCITCYLGNITVEE